MSFQDSDKALSLEKSGCSAAAWGILLMVLGGVVLLSSFFLQTMLWQIFWGIIGITLLMTGYNIRRTKLSADVNPYSADLVEGQPVAPLVAEVHHQNKSRHDHLRDFNPERVILKEAASPLLIGIILLIIGCVWNGFITFFVISTLDKGFQAVDWIWILFLIPFALIGVLMLFGALYFMMANFNPRPVIGLKPGNIPHGDTATLDWYFDKPVSTYYEFNIKLIGEERATYSRGTDRVTDKHKFHDASVYSTVDSAQMQQGNIEFSIARNLMYSWKSTNNAVEWRIEVCGKVRHWPDLNMSLPMTVLPQLDHLEKSLAETDESTQTTDEE